METKMIPTIINSGGKPELWLCEMIDGTLSPVKGPLSVPPDWQDTLRQEEQYQGTNTILLTRNLKGRVLDYAVAKALGYTWVKNASSRYGDSYGSGPPQFPIGNRFFVPPDKAKNLHVTERNWNGWLESDMTEPIGEGALFDVPNFSRRPDVAWPIIDKNRISIIYADAGCKATQDTTTFFTGGTAFVAAMRCFVSITLGKQIEVPNEIFTIKDAS